MDVFRRMLVAIAVSIAFAVLARWLPRNRAAEVQPTDEDRMLPYGAATAIMWVLSLAMLAGGFFGLHAANRLMSNMDHGTGSPLLTVYPKASIWWFFPGFSAMLVPWVVTLAGMRRTGYAGQAARIVIKGNEKTGWDGERVMQFLLWFFVLPIGLFTLPALPMHVSVFSDEIHVVQCGHLTPEVFRFVDARRAYAVDGYRLRDGSFQHHPDLLLDFADGRRFSANAVGDGGSSPSSEMISILLDRSGLVSEHFHTNEELP